MVGMTTPEHDPSVPQQPVTDGTAPEDAAGKPLYAEEDGSQVAQPAVTEVVYAARADSQPAAGQDPSGPRHTEFHHAGLFPADAQHSERAERTGGLLGSIKETLRSSTEGLMQRGEDLAYTARLRMEIAQYGRDLDSLYARLGRAYHRRADFEVLEVIEQEIRRIEADIEQRERQMDTQKVGQELRTRRAAEPHYNLPQPTAPTETRVVITEQAPRMVHDLETERRDTFFGLDKGGVDTQATVTGGNAAFDTQPETESAPRDRYDRSAADS